MEVYLINSIVGAIVVLNGFVAANIENFDYPISSTTCNASAIGMKLDRINSIIMIMESDDRAFRIYIPKLASCIFGACCNKTSVWGEHGRINPVSVGTYCEHKASIVQLEDFYVLVLRARKQQSSIIG